MYETCPESSHSAEWQLQLVVHELLEVQECHVNGEKS